MLYWQNWVGLLLALFILAKCTNGKLFAGMVALFFVSVMIANAMAFGITIDDIIIMDRARASEAMAFLHLVGFIFCPLLLLSCMHIADQSTEHKVRTFYIVFCGLKASFGTAYAATLLNDDLFINLHATVEDYSIIPDMLVLLLGTKNPISVAAANKLRATQDRRISRG